MGQLNKFDIFLQIAKKLNEKNIIPLLMGSVGLEEITMKDWDSKDLDIHVPGDKRGWEVPAEVAIDNWEDIMDLMERLGFELIDLHEHEFVKNHVSVEFGIIDTLPEFAGIMLKDLQMHTVEGAHYFLLTAEQYLKVYQASTQDSYRLEQNNSKDFEKINYLKSICN
ncbi:phosphoribosylanthranilate isomerase [Peribacillus sp. NPDC097675]|uniref:phosphoribosylanthranilate isomerase n=1 Tax=Peribacillus sp. NPDC097675 TaxID=3390618 RepID=UPI003D033B09